MKALRAVISLLPLLFLTQAMADSREITCGDYGQAQARCNFDNSSGVELLAQLSRSTCDEGRTWGQDADGLWVRDSCRAIFRILPGHGAKPLSPKGLSLYRPPAVSRAEDVPADQIAEIYCASQEGRYRHCDADTLARNVFLLHEFSPGNCVYGKTWGHNSRGIWVDGGCGGLFRMKSIFRQPPRFERLICESLVHRESVCPFSLSGRLYLQERLSRAPCVENEHWSLQNQSVRVKDGCRAVFVVLEAGSGLAPWAYGRFEAFDSLRQTQLRLEVRPDGLVRAWRNGHPIYADLDADLLILGRLSYEVAKTREGFRAESTRAGVSWHLEFRRLVD